MSPEAAESNQELVQRLVEELTETRTRLAALEAERQQSTTPEPISAPSKDPKISKPPEFSGKISEYRNFMAQCTLTFIMCPHTYNTDERKVLFVISLLRGPALSLTREIPENINHPFRHDYDAFKTALSNVYLDKNYRELSETKLMSLKQRKSATAYAVEFASLAAPLTLNNESKCMFFYEGLKDDVKDGMAIIGRATTYDELVVQAIAIDQRNHQRRLESKSKSNFGTQSNKFLHGNPRGSNSSTKSSNSSQSKPGTKPFESKPRGPLSEEEKARRKKFNLCHYCADPGHDVKNCPLASSKNKVTMVSLPPPQYPDSTPKSENFQPQAPTRTEA
jgi:Retrotransposon gag protein